MAVQLLKDGYAAWVTALAVFFGMFLTVGACYSFGVYYVLLLEEFKQSKAVTSWVCSLNIGVMTSGGKVFQFALYVL